MKRRTIITTIAGLIGAAAICTILILPENYKSAEEESRPIIVTKDVVMETEKMLR